MGGSGGVGVGVPCRGGVCCVAGVAEVAGAGVVQTEGAVAEDAEGAGLEDTTVENADGNCRWRPCVDEAATSSYLQ